MACKRGAKVILVARSNEALHQLERELNEREDRALAVPVDVADEAGLRHAAERGVQRFGHIDTWVNNAGVSIYGPIRETSIEDMRKLFETNFWGVVNGSRIAVDYLQERGGALINIGSILSDVAMPIQGVYSASKHAVKGFTDSLRMELDLEGRPISVTLIKPASIDTPYPEHARNYLEGRPILPPPLYPPEEVARAILRAATSPMRDVVVGGAGKVMSMLGKHTTHVSDLFMEQTAPWQEEQGPEWRSNDALYQASNDLRVHGRSPGVRMRRSAYTRAVSGGKAGIGVALGILGAGYLLAQSGARQSDGKSDVGAHTV
jgi:NAD(P)-dependent dehydrogenase (short-subunit alcohol dehydrogenase family)